MYEADAPLIYDWFFFRIILGRRGGGVTKFHRRILWNHHRTFGGINVRGFRGLTCFYLRPHERLTK